MKLVSIHAHLKTFQPVVKKQELFYAGFLLYNKRAKTDKTGQMKIIRSLSTPSFTPFFRGKFLY